jgi:hypothetical protein
MAVFSRAEKMYEYYFYYIYNIYIIYIVIYVYNIFLPPPLKPLPNKLPSAICTIFRERHPDVSAV